MSTQLRRLLFLQEIDALLGELERGGQEAEERLGFQVGALSATRERRSHAASGVEPALLRRYEQVRRRHPRAVAPIRGGACLGCFTRRPTMSVGQPDGIESCERCGRILFHADG